MMRTPLHVTTMPPGRAAGRLPFAGLGLVLALALLGCDAETTELIEEINAAREGCTEEQLKAADEACVQMFERYAEMGEGAIETYIGGMRALDEALRRRGGIQFDTAGLGRVFSDSLFGSSARAPLGPDSLELRYLDESEPSFGRAPWGGGGSGWETTAERDARLSPGGPRPLAEPLDASRGIDRRSPPESAARPGAPRRGVLLPPADRLRRPWIGDEPPADPYLGDRDRRAGPQTDREAPPEDRIHRDPEEPIPPYPRE
ncbi:MAG TPA: hypothetical protein VMN39_00850 [Longimicrobiaceae bacterium]|nr:hypothetical protein [Longimicrobiaceae bacterium]